MKGDQGLWIVAGLGVAVAIGVALKNRASSPAGPASSSSTIVPSSSPAPGVYYNPPATAGQVAPIVTPPAAPIAPPAATPAPIVTPPAPAMTAAEMNAAFTAQANYARQLQADYFDQATADTKARVAAGQLVRGTPEYDSAVAYLASRGGVANEAAERARLAAEGLT